MFADRDRNTATFVILFNYTADVIHGEDDGYFGAYGADYQVRYFLDYYMYYNQQTQ